ncbi:MAG: PEP-CTERM sorting domain-containing protein [Pirellulales bacterium]
MRWIASAMGVLVLGQAAVGIAGPYAPAAGQAGSTAIFKDDPAIVAWATNYQNYTFGPNVVAAWQTPAKALAQAVGDSFDIVSLGDGGQITLTFAHSITDGPGYDFAVFENGFADTFLEIAYVEVSSNGNDFFRFANDSLTASPVGGFGAVDPTNITGLAGKYRQGYGTPFDLAELSGASPLLDVNLVSHVRILDVVGDGAYFDTSGDVIYDLYPTTGSGGFDLDAVGVMNAVPEPASIVLFGLALVCTTMAARRRHSIQRHSSLNH